MIVDNLYIYKYFFTHVLVEANMYNMLRCGICVCSAIVRAMNDVDRGLIEFFHLLLFNFSQIIVVDFLFESIMRKKLYKAGQSIPWTALLSKIYVNVTSTLLCNNSAGGIQGYFQESFSAVKILCQLFRSSLNNLGRDQDITQNQNCQGSNQLTLPEISILTMSAAVRSV